MQDDRRSRLAAQASRKGKVVIHNGKADGPEVKGGPNGAGWIVIIIYALIVLAIAYTATGG